MSAEMEETSGETQVSRETGIEEESPFSVPDCLQPRRLMDRVYGLFSRGRPSSAAIKRRYLRTQHKRPREDGTISQADGDNPKTPMKTDSMADSEDSEDQKIGIFYRRRVTSEEAPAGASNQQVIDLEENCPPPSNPQPNICLSPQDGGSPANASAIALRVLDSFQDLQPIQIGINEAPSAPPLPCSESQLHTPHSTPPSARQLFNSVSAPNQSRQQTGSYWRSDVHESPQLGEDISRELMNHRSSAGRRRRQGNTSGQIISKTRSGSTAGGCSAAQFSRGNRRSSIPTSIRRLRISGASGASRPLLRAEHGRVVDSAAEQSPPMNSQGRRPQPSIFQYNSNERLRNGISGSGNVVTVGNTTDFLPSRVENLSPHQTPTRAPCLPRQNVALATNRSNRPSSTAQRTRSHQSPTNNAPSLFDETEMLSNQNRRSRTPEGRSPMRIDLSPTPQSGIHSRQSGEPMPISSNHTAKYSLGEEQEALSQQTEENTSELLLRVRKCEMELHKVVKEKEALQDKYDCEVLCQICWDNKKNAMIFPCSHMLYCRNCLEKHWEGKDEQECPLCRDVVRSVVYIRVDD